MDTLFKKVDEHNPTTDINIIDEAANILRKGGLVAFPTETVYGLGADAFNPAAIKKIYEAKGRPSDNPVVVHVATQEQLNSVISKEPCKNILILEKLMAEFWPGALTFILNKNENIPYQATGGLETVAVRWPANKVAGLLIKNFGPIAAPSANTSGKPSPTRALHVLNDFSGKIEMIIDGGNSDFGLDSTIIDLTAEMPTILRPGTITKEMLAECIGELTQDNIGIDSYSEKAKAPGMKYIHYSPNANLTIVTGDSKRVIEKIKQLTDSPKTKMGIIATEQSKHEYIKDGVTVFSLGDRNNPKEVAANLYDILRQLDTLEIKEAYTEGFDENGIGIAIMNRLKKAAGFNIIKA